MRELTLVLLSALASAFATNGIHAAGAPLSGEAARETLAKTGVLDGVQIEGELDLSGLTSSNGRPLTLNEVELRGSLRNAPAAPLEIWRSKLGGLRAAHAVWANSVEIEHSTFAGHVNLDGARFAKDFACRRCRFSSLSAFRVRFDGDADFSFSQFDGLVDFGGARFHAAAFDGARFSEDAGAPNFSEADFAGEARFPRVSTGAAAANFLGASFRGEANFRSCDFGYAVFSHMNAPGKRAGPLDSDIASFAQLADFRSCRFRRGADFAAAALTGGARFDGATIGAGTLDLRGLTRVEGEIVLHGAILGPQAAIAVDEEAIPHLKTDSTGFDPRRWSGLSPDLLEAVAGRAKALGADRAARGLQFAASGQRVWSGDATLADQATWALQWPSENGTNLLRPVLIGALLWFCAVALALRRGALVELAAPDAEKAGLLARIVEPIYRPLDESTLKTTRLPGDAYERAVAAAAFAFALVFKFGTRRFRPVKASRWRMAGLFVLWLVGYVAVAVIAVTAAQTIPGLRDILSALSGRGGD
ncbi:MAG TPA: hypothetical protein VMU18_10225 [Rhodoblastus sp.]|nr:hypothetical protein [Rhodoblastus sp.]